MKANFVRWQSFSAVLICAGLILGVASCRSKTEQSQQQKQVSDAKAKADAAATETAKSAQPEPPALPKEDKPATPPSEAAAVAGVDGMLKTATTGSGQEQYTAIDDLGERQESPSTVVPALQKLLASDDPQVRWRSARALGDYDTTAVAAAPALLALLSDKDPIVQYYAVVALGKLGDRSDATVDALVTAVTHSDARVARASIAALRNLKPGPERVTAALEKALESDDSAVTEHAMEAIVEGGPEAVPLLNEALKRPKTAYLACAAIEYLGPNAADTVPALIQLIGETAHSQLETRALLALASIGPAAKSASPQLIPLLDHATDATVPVAAAFALGSIGATDADAALTAALSKDNAFLQMIAAWSLAKIHPDDEALVKQAIDKLTQGLTNDEPGIRTAAAKALEKLQAPPEMVAPALMEVAKESDPHALNNVVSALASLGEKIVPKAAEALQNPEKRELAVKVLRQLGPKASGAIEQLTAAIPGASPEFRTEIQFALAAIGPAAAPVTGALVEALNSPETGVRESALYALREIGPGAKDAVPALVTKATSGESFESMAAAWAVAAIAPGDAEAAAKLVPLLTNGLTNASDQVREEAVASLAAFGPASKSAAAALAKVSKEDSSPAVRTAAEQAIVKIGG